MKSHFLRFPFAKPLCLALAACSSMLLFPLNARGATLTTLDLLSVGSGNVFDLSTFNASAAIGESNNLSTAVSRSLAIGGSNTLTDADASLIVGDGNAVSGLFQGVFGQANVVFDGYSFVSGFMNTVHGYLNLVAGQCNSVTASSSVMAESNAVFGAWNFVHDINACFISGSLNQLDTATDSAAFGHGLILPAGTQSQIVVGQYNAPAPVDARFVVGNGAGSSNRSNGFIVLANGDSSVSGGLRVKPAGDISMGSFTQGPLPLP